MRIRAAFFTHAALLALSLSGAAVAADSGDGSLAQGTATPAPTTAIPTTPAPTEAPTPAPTPTMLATPTPTTPAPTTPAPTTPVPTPPPSITPVPTTTAPPPPPPTTPTPTDSKETTAPPPAPKSPTPFVPPSTTTPAPSTTTTPPPPSPPTPTSAIDDATPNSSPTPPAATIAEPVESPPPPVGLPPPVDLQPPSVPSPIAVSPVASPPPVSGPSDPSSPSPIAQDRSPTSAIVSPQATPVTAADREMSSSASASHANDPNTPAGPTPSPSPTTLEYSVESTGSTPMPPQIKPYRRGDNVMLVEKTLANGSTVNVEVVVNHAEAPVVLVRNANALGAGFIDGDAGKASGGVSAVGVLASALAALTLLLLFVFHFIALEPNWTTSVTDFLRPNQWELLVFVTYIQSMTSTAHLTVTAVPASLWQFVDAFSWTVFIPVHQSTPAVTATQSDKSRRLSEYYVLDGIIAFADRIGVDETLLLQESIATMVVMGLLGLLLAFFFVLFVKQQQVEHLKHTQKNTDPFGTGMLPRTLAHQDSCDSVEAPDPTCRPTAVMGGVIVVMGVIALYPVTVLSSFEISSQIYDTNTYAGSLMVAIVSLVLIPVFLVVRTIAMLKRGVNEAEFKRNPTYRIKWGVFCSSDSVRFDGRVVLAIAWLAMQLSSALVVGIVLSAGWQLALLVAIDVAFLAIILVKRPFAEGSQIAMVATVAVAVLKILNTALACAFLGTSSPATLGNSAASTAYVAINALVIMFWSLRQLVISVRLTKIYWSHCSRQRASTNKATLPEASDASSQPAPASQLAQSPSDAAYQSTLYIALASTENGERGTAVL